MKPTTDEVLKWAREAGGWQQWEARVMTPQVLERFAALAYAAGAAAMKERAAKECEEIHGYYTEEMFPENGDKEDHSIATVTRAVTTICAGAIRALGDDDE